MRYLHAMSWTSLQIRADRVIATAANLVLAVICLALAQPAIAQTTTTFTNTTTGTINSGTTCTNPLVRNFTVSSNFTISDVNIGILVQHSWRGDLQFTLQSPSGTRVRLTNGDTQNVSGDNFNVLLDDSAAALVNSDSATGSHSNPTPFSPPYQNTFRPRNALSSFNGQNSAGTWRLETCDLFPSQDDGQFRRADLYLTSAPTNYADLSLTKALVGSPPIQGGTATWRLTVTNASTSPSTANSVVVRDTFPTGFTFVSASGEGSFNSTTRDWTVGSLTPGQSKTLTIRGTISSAAGTTVTNIAEITASSLADLDSTVNNGATAEDDYASSSFTVQTGRSPGVPPVLACPAGTSIFDWDTISGWTNGTTDNSYAFTTYGNARFQLTNDGAFLNSANFGGQTPTVVDYYSGGLVPAQDSLHMLSDQANQSGVVTITITLPRSFTGLQFSIFDVDFGANQFADRVVVTGSNGGTTVNPTLTNGNVNFVSGNTVIGDGVSGNGEALGNVVVTFSQAVDTVTISYGNHTTAPTNPGQQGISIHDITVCKPFTTLSVSKVSSVISDPVNGTTNPKAIPGATIEYLITVTNTGSQPTDSDTVTVWDDGPADAKLCLIGRTGGPVIYNDPGGNSGLTYIFTSLASTTDSLEFSNNGGSTFAYIPVADGDGCDGAVTDFRVRPGGAFGGSRSFTLTVRFQVE
ncbi:MAG: proprotein convertase P-domain-containing protein [Erythrobacter sp.]